MPYSTFLTCRRTTRRTTNPYEIERPKNVQPIDSILSQWAVMSCYGEVTIDPQIGQKIEIMELGLALADSGCGGRVDDRSISSGGSSAQGQLIILHYSESTPQEVSTTVPTTDNRCRVLIDTRVSRTKHQLQTVMLHPLHTDYIITALQNIAIGQGPDNS